MCREHHALMTGCKPQTVVNFWIAHDDFALGFVVLFFRTAWWNRRNKQSVLKGFGSYWLLQSCSGLFLASLRGVLDYLEWLLNPKSLGKWKPEKFLSLEAHGPAPCSKHPQLYLLSLGKMHTIEAEDLLGLNALCLMSEDLRLRCVVKDFYH